MARPVEAPAPHAKLEPRLRHRVAHGRLRRPLVERGLEQPDERRTRHALPEEPDAGDVRRGVRRRDRLERLHGLERFLVHQPAAGDAAREDRLEADRRQVAFVLQMAAVHQLLPAIRDGRRVVSHPLEAALVQQLLAPPSNSNRRHLSEVEPRLATRIFMASPSSPSSG